MESTEEKHSADTQPIRVRHFRRVPSVAGSNPGLESESATGSGGEPSEKTRFQDQIPTPPPLELPVRGRITRQIRSRSSCAMWAVILFCLAASVASLVISVMLMTNLLTVRKALVNGVDQAIAGLNNLEVNGFAYDYHLQQTIPFSGDVPFHQEFVFPFKGDVPIDTTVTVPINAGVLGQFTLDVPINTSIPLDIEVPVEISQTFHIDTQVPIDMTIPIAISPDDPAIDRLLRGVRDWLIGIRQLL
jgi:hypothetical protein